jgi:hypothetical protein
MWPFNADARLLAAIESLADSTKNVVVILDDIANELDDIRFSLSRPGTLTLCLLEQNMSTISFKVALPQLLDSDVVNRELSVQVGDLPPDVRTLPKDAIEEADYSGPQDAPVRLSLVDIDDAGNRSIASTLDAVLLDVFPPAQPGELALTVTGETA